MAHNDTSRPYIVLVSGTLKAGQGALFKEIFSPLVSAWHATAVKDVVCAIY